MPQERYELIDAFPSSLSKYEVSLIAATLEGVDDNPCNALYEQLDYHSGESTEDIVERLAFEEKEKLQFYLDAKSTMFNSRRVNAVLLANYLKSKFNYDPVKMEDFRDDKNALFIMLFHETYNEDDNTLSDEFMEARAASHKFKDRRDRMTTIEDEFNLDDIKENVETFEENMRAENPTICNSYINEGLDTLTILLRQEHKRDLMSTFEYRRDGTEKTTENLDIVYVETYPVRETAVKIRVVENGTEVQVYSSVSSWSDTFMQLFLNILDMDIIDRLEGKQSSTARQIMEDVKEDAMESDNSPSSGANVQNIVSDHVSKAAQDVDEEDSTVNAEYVKSKLDNTVVTGVKVDGDDPTFEIHNSEGIYALLDEYEGMASSLSKAVGSADIDDITLYARVPNANDDDDDELVLENGEWDMSSNTSQETLKALEAALK